MNGEHLNTPIHPPTDERWSLEEAFEMCRILERIAPVFGAHVALTGGLLYKEGPRKDCAFANARSR